MCTLYTFSYEFYNENKTSIKERIRADAKINSDGASLLIGYGEEALAIQSFDIELLLGLIEIRLDSITKRCWLHLRMATTGFTGINGTHGFIGDQWRVYHNGMLSRKESYQYNVDSQLIAADIEQYGIKVALDLLKEDHYANVMAVNTMTGEYRVHRTGGGSLYMDSKGNYSTFPIASINKSVAAGYSKRYQNDDTYSKTYVGPYGMYWEEGLYGEGEDEDENEPDDWDDIKSLLG